MRPAQRSSSVHAAGAGPVPPRGQGMSLVRGQPGHAGQLAQAEAASEARQGTGWGRCALHGGRRQATGRPPLLCALLRTCLRLPRVLAPCPAPARLAGPHGACWLQRM